MKLHSSLLIFFIFFYSTESMVRTFHNKNRVIGRIANYTYFIRRGKEQDNEQVNKQIRKTFNDSTEEGKKAIFGDVIKNITRVNSVLEELIRNYEKLKHLYNTEETFEHDIPDGRSTDIEIDEAYKLRNPRAKESDNELVARNPNGLDTDMLYDEREETKAENKDHKKHGNMLYNKQDKRAPIIQFFKQSLKGNLRSLKVTRHVDDISSDISSVSIESGTIDNKIQEISQKPKQNKLTLEFKMPKSEKLKLATEKNIVGMAKNGNPLMKTVIKAEEYTSNFDKNWDKLTNKAPVSLRTEKEVIYEKGPRKNVYSKVVSAPFKKEDKDETRAVPAKINTVQKFRSIHVKTGKTVEKELTKINHTRQLRAANLPMEAIDWSVENDKTIEKEQFKTSILRKAYGDACLKVVVKKCYKACKQVTKTGCVKYDCKQDFINEFKNHAKKGCLAEFGDETVIHKANDNEDENDFIDITRSGYLASACLPSRIRHKPISVVQRTTGNVTTPPQLNQLNILRDRFEVACQKASADKCKRACYYATGQVCSTHDCKVGKKSNLARECRAHCKEAYRYTNEDKSDDSDSDLDTLGSEESSSASENTYNDSRPDPDFELYLNSTTPNALNNKKKATKSGLDSESIMKANLKQNRAFGNKRSFSNSKILL